MKVEDIEEIERLAYTAQITISEAWKKLTEAEDEVFWLWNYVNEVKKREKE